MVYAKADDRKGGGVGDHERRTHQVLDRAVARAEVFHRTDDYDAFLALIADASARLPIRVFGYSLMPNHFHLVVRPHTDGDLSRWMQRLLATHVRRYHRRYGSSGHVWQGRFKAFPCQEDGHLLTVLRYVERNALRANLVPRAEDWPHGSLHALAHPPGPVALEPLPERPDTDDRIARANAPRTEPELDAMRRCVARGAPSGAEPWARRTAEALGLQASLRPRGRPPKATTPAPLGTSSRRAASRPRRRAGAGLPGPAPQPSRTCRLTTPSFSLPRARSPGHHPDTITDAGSRS